MQVYRAGSIASLAFLALFTACGRPPPAEPLAAREPIAQPAAPRARVVLDERVSPSARLLRREDGTATAVLTPGPRAFLDEAGQWQEIDPRLTRVQGGLSAEKNLVRARFPERLSARAGVRFEDPETGAGFSWRPAWSGSSAPVSVEGAQDVARYAIPGAAEEFHVLPGGVKHNLVLESREAVDRALRSGPEGTLQAIGTLALDPGVSLQERGAALAVVGARGVLFELPAPRAFELTGERRALAARYRWSPSTGALAVEVDAAWLRAPERTFPLAIDPPATVLSRHAVSVLADSAAGPGSLVVGPDQLRLGALSAAQSEYYQVALKFDLSGINPGATILSVAINTFFGGSGTATSQPVHYAPLVRDPETTGAAALWADGVHGAHADYAVVASVPFACNCWINGGAPATQTGTALGPAATADLQASLPSQRFFVGMHVPSYVANSNAEPHGILDPNPPQLYVDFSATAPVVTQLAPASVPFGSGGTVTLRGAGFRGQGATTVTLTPVGGGAPTGVALTYVSASQLTLSVPGGLPAGVYDAVVTVGGQSSPVVPEDRLTVSALKTWVGTASTSWSNPANWSPASVPDAASDVVIAPASYGCTLDLASATVRSLRVAGGTLTTAGNGLVLTGDLSVDTGTLSQTAGGTVLVGGNVFVNGTLASGSGTLALNGGSLLAPAAVGRGRLLFEDVEGAAAGWAFGTVSGAPNPWRVQEAVAASGYRSWYQQGEQLTAGSAALTSPTFSLTGRSTAALRWRHRYRVNLEDQSGPNTSDGFVVQVSINGGSTWATVAPTAASLGAHAPKASGPTCPAGGGRTANPVVAGTGGLFAGMQTQWVQETVNLTPYVGNANVKVRFWSGWDNCNDYAPWDGVYIDDVLVTGDEAPLALNHLVVNGGKVAAWTGLTLAGDLTVASASSLDLNGAGLTVAGNATNLGTLLRGPAGTLSVTGTFSNYGTFRMGSGPVTFGQLSNPGTFAGGAGDVTTNGAFGNSGTFISGTGQTNVNGAFTSSSAFVNAGTGLTVVGDLNNGGTLDLGKGTLTIGGAGASNVTGGGSYLASRKQLFADGFESGSFAAGGWTATSSGAPPDPQVVATPPGIGARVANLSAGNGFYNSWITRPLSTAGQTGVWLSYGRATSAAAGTYLLEAQFSTDNGGTWQTARVHPGTFGYGVESINLSALDPAVDNNPNFVLRFHSYTTATGNFHYVDDVKVEAAQPGVGPLAFTGAGVKTLSPTNAAQAFTLQATLNLSGGTLRVAPGKTLAIDNAAILSSVSSPGTTLDVEAGATLKLSANTVLQLNGTLELVGVAGTPARVTSTDTATPGRYALTVYGGFNGSYFDIDYANGSGLNLSSPAVVSSLSYGSFHHPPAGGVLLTIATPSLPASSTGCVFANEAAVAGAFGVNGSSTSGTLRFDAATGPLAGEAKDLDFAGGTPGNITWGPTHFAFLTGPQTVPAGSCNPISVQAQDESNVAAAVSANIPVAPSSSSGTNGFFADPSCGSAVGGAVLAAPAHTLTLHFRDTVVGTELLTFSPTGFAAISQTETIVAGPASKLTFQVEPGGGTAGVAISPAIKVATVDSFGNVATAGASVTLSLFTNPGGATLSGAGPVAVAGGVATFAGVTLNKAAAGYQLQASAAGLTSAVSAAFQILAGAPAQLVVTTAPQTVTSDVCSAPVALELKDAYGNTASYGSGTGIALSSSVLTTRFYPASDTGCTGAAMTSVALPAGATGAAFRFRDSTAGPVVLTATVAALGASQTEQIEATPPTALRFVTTPQSVAAGACSGAVTVQLEDAAAKPTSAGTATTVALSSSSPSTRFFPSPSCGGGQVGTLNIPAGGTSGTFYFQDIQAGAPTLTAAAPPLAAATQAQQVYAGPAALLTVGGFPNPTRAGINGTFTVTVVDAYDNPAESWGGTVSFSSSDPSARLPAPYTFSPSDKGTHVFTAAFSTLGSQDLKATDGNTLIAKQGGIEVLPGAVGSLKVMGVASPAAAGQALDVTVIALDDLGNVVNDYTGTVRFSSSDPRATLPAATAFTLSDGGKRTFQQLLTFGTPGTHQLTAQDASSSSVKGQQLGIVITAAQAPRVVHDANPRAAVGAPYVYNAARAVTATGAPTLSYSACGGPSGFRVDALSGAVRWTPDSAGGASLCVAAKNAQGEDRYAFEVTVADRAPTDVKAAFTRTPTDGPAPLLVELDGSPSAADASARPLLFQWSAGDGSAPLYGELTSHRYVLPGGYRVRLRAYDAFGAFADADAPVLVRGAQGALPPSARIIASALRGKDSLEVSLSCDCAKGGAELSTYLWDLGDGTTSSSATAQVRFGPGRYHVGLRVVDAAGLAATDKVEVVVTQGALEPPECTAAVEPPAGVAPLAVTWTAIAASPTGRISSQQWTLDAEQSAQTTLSRGYPEPGRYTATLEVVDEAGLHCTDSVVATAVTAAGAPPRIVSEPGSDARCGAAYAFSQSGAVNAEGDGPFTWSAPGAPAGFTVDPATGAVSWRPTPAQRGAHTLRVHVESPAGSDEREFDVEVSCADGIELGTSCGCGAGPDGAALVGLLLIGLAGLRRRRRTAH